MTYYVIICKTAVVRSCVLLSTCPRRLRSLMWKKNITSPRRNANLLKRFSAGHPRKSNTIWPRYMAFFSNSKLCHGLLNYSPGVIFGLDLFSSLLVSDVSQNRFLCAPTPFQASHVVPMVKGIILFFLTGACPTFLIVLHRSSNHFFFHFKSFFKIFRVRSYRSSAHSHFSPPQTIRNDWRPYVLKHGGNR